MPAPEPGTTRSVDPSAWSPPLPEASGFHHFVIGTPGLLTHVAAIGEGEPVVLLHGFPQHWWEWQEIAPLIAEGGYRVLCPDLRGAGWTVADDSRIERTTRLRDLLAVFDGLGIESAHLVAHDMGAITATQMAYEHPERVRTAVHLSAPPAFMRFSPQLIPALRHMPALVWHRKEASLRGLFSEDYVTVPMSESALESHLAPMRRPDIDRAVRPLYRGMVLPEAMRLFRGVYRRRRLTVPTLVVFGRHDGDFPEELVQRICRNPERHADRIEFAYVDHASHFITDDAPTAVADLALDWFERPHPVRRGGGGSTPDTRGG